ncbi:MAG: Methyltransferase type 11, partial [Thermoleophilia bacterium]|nr:Methyltransferase type 11 [Thermoleophilia bacterium]
RAVEVTGLDVQPVMLEEAARRTEGRVKLVLGNALDLPFDDGAFDIATCSLMLHHFQPAEALQVLREMRRVSSAVLVNDLIRAWHPWIVAKLLSHTVTRNELTRFDGPVSVLRAYTPAELKLLFEAAGLTPRWRASLLGYRMALLGMPD